MPRSHATALALALLGCLALSGCPEDEVVVPNLFIRVRSEAPTGGGKLESLRILFEKGGVRFPATIGADGFDRELGALDPTREPVLFSIDYDGTTFGDGRDVVAYVTGRIGN